ncbi:MAG: phosphoribosyltransferase family protein [Bacteroidales bacterium]|nr:phosphoribosyltransferase family protein [Bacteroidales bacterium]
MHGLFDDFISLFYPKICHACGNSLYRNEEVICTFCRYHLPKTNFHLDQDNMLAKVFWGRVRLENTIAMYFFTKAGKVQHLLHQLKYKNKPEIGVFLGNLYGLELIKHEPFTSINMVIPVPLHPKKQRKRGYNQSEQFAIGLAQTMNIPVESRLLIRTHASETQTRKSRFSRWQNVSEIFAVTNPSAISGKHILLVDDVITTGATIEACAAKLYETENVKVSAASIGCTHN